MSGVNTTGDSHVARFFDEYAEKEWQRNDSDLVGRIAWAIHMQFTLKHIDRGDRVLDAGSGPGRGALAMLERGASVTLADISRVQLRPCEAEDRGLRVPGRRFCVGISHGLGL